MKYIVDAQLPPRLAHALREAGEDAVAVRELGLREAEDETIWAYALEHGAAIVTKDQDFADRYPGGGAFPVVVWLRVGNTSNAALLAWLMPHWPGVRQRVEAGDRLIEVR